MSQAEFAVNFFVALFALLDPIGNVPLFAAATAGTKSRDRAMIAVYISLFVLGFLTLVLGGTHRVQQAKRDVVALCHYLQSGQRFDDFDVLVGQFPPLPGVRSVIRCHLDRIQSSCGSLNCRFNSLISRHESKS